jgi:hypothetical protein
VDNNLFLAIAIGGALFLMFRKRRSRDRARPRLFGRLQPDAGAQPAQPRDTMPRIGTPHTVTIEQLDALERFDFPRERSWSREEADLILDAVTYLRAVCAEAIDDALPEVNVQNELLHLILSQQDLRDYVRAWGERRRADEASGLEPMPLPHNNQYDRVAKAARELAAG